MRFLEQSQYAVGDFLGAGATSLAATLGTNTPGGIGHYLRQVNPVGLQSVGVFGDRLPDDRGNAYPNGTSLVGPDVARFDIAPSFDCRNTGFGEGPADESQTEGRSGTSPGCHVLTPLPGFQGRYPRVHADRSPRR